MRFSRLLLASLISFGAAAQAQTTESAPQPAEQPVTQAAELSPQQVTALFFRTLLHSDIEAMAELNAYTQPARDASKLPGPFINIQEMQWTDAMFPSSLANRMIENIKLDEADRNKFQPDLVELFIAMRAAQKRTRCTFGEATPVTQGVRQGYKGVTVAYTCLTINPPEKMLAVIQRSLDEDWITLAQYREGFTPLTKGYQEGPMTQEFKGEFPLTSKEGTTVWQNTRPHESLNISNYLY